MAMDSFLLPYGSFTKVKKGWDWVELPDGFSTPLWEFRWHRGLNPVEVGLPQASTPLWEFPGHREEMSAESSVRRASTPLWEFRVKGYVAGEEDLLTSNASTPLWEFRESP